MADTPMPLGAPPAGNSSDEGQSGTGDAADAELDGSHADRFAQAKSYFEAQASARSQYLARRDIPGGPVLPSPSADSSGQLSAVSRMSAASRISDREHPLSLAKSEQAEANGPDQAAGLGGRDADGAATEVGGMASDSPLRTVGLALTRKLVGDDDAEAQRLASAEVNFSPATTGASGAGAERRWTLKSVIDEVSKSFMSSVGSELGRSSAGGGARARPLLSDDGPLRRSAQVEEVNILVVDQEWGAGIDLSSSSDSDDFFRNRRSSVTVPRRGVDAPQASDDPQGAGQQHEVQVRMETGEWGGGAGISSSSSGSSSSSDSAPPTGRAARAAQRRHGPRKSWVGDGATGVASAVGVARAVGVAAGNAGSVGSPSAPASGDVEENTVAPAAAKAARKPMFAFEVESVAAESSANGRRPASGGFAGHSDQSAGPRQRKASMAIAPTMTMGIRVPICPEMKRLSFVGYAVLHMCDWLLRAGCLALWAHHSRNLFCLEWTLLASGAAMSIYITFHDADVLLLLHEQPTFWHRFVLAWFFLVVLGCFQVIQVKRAYARQVQSAEALFEMGDEPKKGKTRKQRTGAMPSFADAERIMPVALFTGVPFLLINHIWDDECGVSMVSDFGRSVVSAANVVVAFTVSLGVADLDYEVSHLIWKRYHLRRRAEWRNVKKLFPLLHKSFRAAEVYFRMNVITGFILVCTRYKLWQELVIFVPFLDYLMGVALLNWNSPDKERNCVHFIAGLAMTFVDTALFVDRQNFAAPARRISHWLICFRTCEFAFVAGVLLATLVAQGQDHGTTKCSDLHFVPDVLPLMGSAGLYYLMRHFFPLRKLGHDLHTAAAKGANKRLKALLAPDVNGQVRNVNALSKDSRGMTPLMYAAEAGELEAIEMLLGAGASVDIRTECGNTCLHFAARRRQAAACSLLVSHGADPRMANNLGETPWMVVPRPRRNRSTRHDSFDTDFQESFSGEVDLRRILNPRGASKKDVGHFNATYQVTAAPTPGLHLHNLFPEVEKDDAPSPRVLQSVSALVVSRAAGKLARRVLARQDDNGNGVPLGALKRVRELGKGGFGRVIEVELPCDASRGIWWTPGSPQAQTRYALKLQLKRDQQQAQSEVLALRRAAHPFIVHLERAFSFDRFFALLLELCPTDLNRKLCEQDENGRSLGVKSADAARYIGQVLLALAFLHKEEKIVFRDVKPENILISLHDEAKLTDFGLAKVVTSAQRMTMCGTAGFLPPECTAMGSAAALASALNSNSGGGVSADSGCEENVVGRDNSDPGRLRNAFKIDSYALGVTLQLTLLGEDGGRRREIHKKGPMMLPLHHTEEENTAMLAQLRDNGRLSDEAFDLLTEHLLCEDVRQRRCLFDQKVVNHPFFLKELKCDDLQEHLMPSPIPTVGRSNSLLPSFPSISSMKFPFLWSEASPACRTPSTRTP